jgi:2-polyprenyl-6-methoxyphenol hydroxylase-like FAD-dependent oxidoreductase
MDPSACKPTPFDGSVLLGADGATGRVRESLGIEMPGKDYASPALRIFFQRDLRHYVSDLAPVTYLFSGGRSCSLLQMAGGWRAILRLSEHTSDDVALARPFQLAELRRFLPIDAAAFENASADLYRSSRRVAVRNHKGRVFLMGDAAHLTNTRGGMNMNCGIHDADAISRSLIYSLRENQPGHVLACAEERLRVAHECLVPRTDTSVASPDAWFHSIRKLSTDPLKSLAYLHQATMLDMV